MKKEGAKRCNLGKKLQNVDQFGQSFSMLIDEGRDTLPSGLGAICSILLLVCMLFYTGYKVSILNGKKSIDIVQAVKENHFDSNDKFGAAQGLNIAVSVFDTFDPTSYQLLDPSYGKITFTSLAWEH